jgi:hypothetical protein
MVNAKQVKLAEDFVCIPLLCAFELACISFRYIAREKNDSNVLRSIAPESICKMK